MKPHAETVVIATVRQDSSAGNVGDNLRERERGWYVKSRGMRKEGPVVRKRPSEGRKARTLPTSSGTREGTKLWWWIEGGVGGHGPDERQGRETGARTSEPIEA